MKKVSIRNIVILFLFVFVVYQNAYPQSKNQKLKVTPAMAKKISYLCQSNERVFIFFANANEDVVKNRRDIADRILAKLENHLDYAENFIIDLYYSYGTEIAYFALKDAGFTIQEHDIADAIWKKAQQEQKQAEQKRQQKLKQIELKQQQEQKQIELERQQAKKKAELAKEQEVFDLAMNGETFGFHALSNKPKITLDMAHMARNISRFRNNKRIAWNENIDHTFNCIISKDKTLELILSEDSITSTSTQKILWEYIKNNIVVQNHANIQFNQLDTTLIVSARTNLRITQKPTRYRTIIEFNASKDKKTKKWSINNPDKVKRKLNSINKNSGESIYYDIMENLYYNPYFDLFEKGKYPIKAVIVENSLKYYVDNKLQEEAPMSFSFEFSCNKKNFMDRIYQSPN